MNDGARRLFLALWPDQALLEAFVAVQREARRETGGRAVPVENLHLTLAFLGTVPRAHVDAVAAACRAVALEPHRLVLDRVGLWPRGGILWIGTNDIPAPLARLVEGLKAALEPLGFVPERRRFHAHVTLCRNARHRPSWQGEPIEWGVDRFCLVESDLSGAGAAYRVLETFAAGAAGARGQASETPGA